MWVGVCNEIELQPFGGFCKTKQITGQKEGKIGSRFFFLLGKDCMEGG